MYITEGQAIASIKERLEEGEPHLLQERLGTTYGTPDTPETYDLFSTGWKVPKPAPPTEVCTLRSLWCYQSLSLALPLLSFLLSISRKEDTAICSAKEPGDELVK